MIEESTSDADGVTQKLVNLHSDPIEYEERMSKAGYVLPMVLGKQIPNLIDKNDSIFDIGCGTGAVAKTLEEKIGHHGHRIANDISPVMLEHVRGLELYGVVAYGKAAYWAQNLVASGNDVDWAIALSSTYYMSPPELGELLEALYKLCQKGIILSFDGVTPPLYKSPNIIERAGGEIHLYDHRGYFDKNPIPPRLGWKALTFWEGVGWTHQVTGIDVECEMVYIFRD